ncbi:15949_t:CDS:2, partial [Funneliformis geosporum]
EDVSSGTYGNVSRANWKGSIMALKHSYNLTIKEIFNEEHFINLKWSCKFQLALELANAVACIHNEGIIHSCTKCVHQNHIKLADFGLSRKITDESSYSTDVMRENIVMDTPIEYSNLYEETDKSLDKAFYWYQRAANNGNLCGLFNLGRCNELGIGIEKNEKETFKIFKELAENGYDNAKFYLGYFYNQGVGTKKDLKKANYWYHKVAENDNVVALHDLSYVKGTKNTLEKTFHWYRKAVENGSINAQIKLSALYGYCEAVKKDFEMYFYWIEVNKEIVFKLYNEDTNKKVSNMQNIESLYENADKMNDLDNVNYWYHKAAEHDNKCALYKLGCLEAQYEVGYFYDNGIEIDVNKERVIELYKIAANEGSCDAQERLAYLYEHGEGINKI